MLTNSKLATIIVSVLLVSGLFMIACDSQALTPPIEKFTSAYRQYKKIDNLSINVPTVVEVPFEQEFLERYDFAVLDTTATSFEPHFFKKETYIEEIPITIEANEDSGQEQSMLDENPETYAEFSLSENKGGEAEIVLNSPSPITASALTILLDEHVALPNTIEIRAEVKGEQKVIVARRKLTKNTIHFPQTNSDRWTIKLDYSQPLRITELRLHQENKKETSSSLRFLAQPNHSYRVYFNPDRPVNPPVGEAGDLKNSEGILRIDSAQSQSNPDYEIADVDNDGIADIYDNCVRTPNPDQKDVNSNNKGDACEDFDKDGIINSEDNCPNHPNKDQADKDGDGIGDVCDEEESRITERYKWIPWTGIGFAGLVLIILLGLTVKSLNKETGKHLNLDSNDKREKQEKEDEQQ